MVTYRSRSVPSSATSTAVAPRSSAAAARSASSFGGRTACSQTPQPVSDDMRADLVGQQFQAARAVGPDDVPGQHAAQTRADVLLQPGANLFGRAGRGKGIDHLVRNELGARVHAVV